MWPDLAKLYKVVSINFNDIIFPNVNSGWLFAPSPAIPANVNPVILDWTKLANGNGSLVLSNLEITRNPALGGLNHLTIYWVVNFHFQEERYLQAV